MQARRDCDCAGGHRPSSTGRQGKRPCIRECSIARTGWRVRADTAWRAAVQPPAVLHGDEDRVHAGTARRGVVHPRAGSGWAGVQDPSGVRAGVHPPHGLSHGRQAPVTHPNERGTAGFPAGRPAQDVASQGGRLYGAGQEARLRPSRRGNGRRDASPKDKEGVARRPDCSRHSGAVRASGQGRNQLQGQGGWYGVANQP